MHLFFFLYRYIFSVIEISRYHPELIVFLDIFDEVKLFRDDYHRVHSNVVLKATNEIDTQTDLHPIPFKRDKDYTWNIWDLRRRAIQLANIRKCNTTSAQTSVSYERFGVKIQTWSPRTSSCQTMTDAATSIPKPQVVIEHTRGVSPDRLVTQVNLTLNVED